MAEPASEGAVRPECGSPVALPSVGAGVMVPLLLTRLTTSTIEGAVSAPPLPTLRLGLAVEFTISPAPVIVRRALLLSEMPVSAEDIEQSAHPASALAVPATSAVAETWLVASPSSARNIVRRLSVTVASTVRTWATVAVGDPLESR